MIEIAPLGDAAFLLHPADETAGSETVLDRVLAAVAAIEHAEIPGIIECVAAYDTVAVFYDAAEVARRCVDPAELGPWLTEQIRQAMATSRKRRRAARKSRMVEVPICCDEEFAPDLSEVAERAGLSSAEVIKLYCDASYQVGCVGFTPGFPYLTGLPKQLATPRRTVPREKVPGGSVGIGGAQTGIYPLASPGGWNIIGRTPLVLFDPLTNPPALLHPGDLVRFRVVTRAEFDRSQP